MRRSWSEPEMMVRAGESPLNLDRGGEGGGAPRHLGAPLLLHLQVVVHRVHVKILELDPNLEQQVIKGLPPCPSLWEQL